MSGEHRIGDVYMLEDHTRTSIYEGAEVISKLYANGGERHAKQIGDLLHAENFEVNVILETLKDFSECILFFRETGNESSERIGFDY